MTRRWAVVASCVALAVLVACGEVDHEALDDWRETEKGPVKLRDALADPELAPDLRAHAAQNLVALSDWPAVKQRLGEMSERDRHAVAAKLADRLMRDATVPAGYSPSPLHAATKDALFRLRELAAADTRAAIDGYLADWLGVNFADRVNRGAVSGITIVKHVGADAAPELIAEARSIMAAPADEQGRIPMFSNELLKALAYTGDPAAAGLLIDLGKREHPEPSLQGRALDALYVAYVDDLEKPAPDPAALEPHVERLAAIVRDYNQPGRNINNAFALLGTAPAPACVAPLVDLVETPREEQAYLWAAVQKGVQCAGPDHLAKILDAMPTDRPYQRGILEKYLWDKLAALEPRASLVSACRELLRSDNWVARVTAVECLGRWGAAQDAEALAGLSGDRTTLVGWWGPQEDVPRGQRRRDPTLGSVAQEVAKKL